MISSVITSKDPYLLARFATDMMMDGVDFDCIGLHDPFESKCEHLLTWSECRPQFFYTNNPDFDCARFILTQSNYLEILEKVLS